jgi:uncharacterized protein YjbI with pentapeptide repeats
MEAIMRGNSPGPWLARRQTIRSPLIVPFGLIEWSLEWAVFILKRWALVDLLEIIAAFGVFWAAWQYVSTRDEVRDHERRTRHYEAWTLINTAVGQSGDGGRTLALQDLLADSVRLDRLNAKHAALQRIELPNAYLIEAFLDSATLWHGYLPGAKLNNASLIGADLQYANLCATHFIGADARFAQLQHADLRNADLRFANLDSANLVYADLRGADLSGASLRGTFISAVQADGADLRFADLRGAVFYLPELERGTVSGANIHGASLYDSTEYRHAMADLKMLDQPIDSLWEQTVGGFVTVSDESAVRRQEECAAITDANLKQWRQAGDSLGRARRVFQ